MSTLTRRALAVTGAAAAALALWAAAGPMAGIDLTVRLGGVLQPIGPASVAATSLIVGLAGWALLAVLERTTKRPGRIWMIIAEIVCVLSLAGPLTSATDTASMAVLAGMHVIVAAVLIPVMGRSAIYK